jgi:predicted nucleic acid-binding protein
LKILDTDVCIEILRGNHKVIEHRATTPDEIATTWITACELSYGAAKSRQPDNNQTLVIEFLSTLPIIDFTLPASEYFGKLKAQLEKSGNRIADADLLIASVTMANSASLITGNLRHYQRIDGLRIEDWIRGDF